MAESDKYEVLGKIGQGSFGVISKVRRKSDGLILCRKEISYFKMSAKEREQLQAELSILKDLRHPHIVQYYEREHLKDTQDLRMYMEFCGNGDLGQVIKGYKSRSERAPETFVWSIFSQIIEALYRCHNGVDAPDVTAEWFGLNKKRPVTVKSAKMVVIHRDLKPENIFLDDDNNVKLGDFGLSKIIKSHDFASTYVGTPYYMSPELAGSERYSSASDIWSLGCIIYELCTLEVPFNARSHIELFQKIRAGKFRPIPPVYSEELQKVISSCLQTNPNSRPTAAQLLGLPVVCVTRKQNEAVDLHKDLQKRAKELEAQAQRVHEEMDSKLRREWEVKARLEIDRQVAATKTELISQFDNAVAAKAEEMFQARMRALDASRRDSGNSAMSGKTAIDTASNSSDNMGKMLTENTQVSYLVSGNLGEGIDRLSLDSDATVATQTSPAESAPRSRPARTPFTRAHTLAANPVTQSFEMTDCFSPMDVHMASPSPDSIGGLNLSPRRDGTNTSQPSTTRSNIFDAANAAANSIDPSKRWLPTNASEFDSLPSDLSSDEDETTEAEDTTMHSPSRTLPKRKPTTPKASAPQRKPRPSLARERTAPANMKRLTSAPSLFPTNALPTTTAKPRPASAVPVIAASPARKTAAVISDSPTRTLRSTVTSPARKTINNSTFRSKKAGADGDATMVKAALRNVQGRTLVELAQARAGGVDRGIDGPLKSTAMYTSPTKGAPVWDPERDDMPSPFLARGRNVVITRTMR